MSDLPLLGAAMTVAELATYQDLILSENRDLEIQDFCRPGIFNGDWRATADRAKELLQGYTGRLGIHGPFWGITIANPDPDFRVLTRKKMMEALDAAEHIGATQMVIHSPYSCWSAHNNDYIGTEDARTLAWAHDTLDEVIARAETMDCMLVIENIDDIRPDDRMAMVREFNSSHVKLSVDTGHAMYAHGTNGAPAVDFYVMRAGNHLGHVHLQDADGYADRHWQIGRGQVPWHAIFKSLKAIESNPRLILELRDKSEIQASIDWLRAEGLAR